MRWWTRRLRAAASRPGPGAPAPQGLVDIHVHLLPGVDDGPGSWEQALAMARAAWEAGVRLAVATPHLVPGSAGAVAPERLTALVEELRRRLEQAGIGLCVLVGAEVYPVPQLVQLLREPALVPLGGVGQGRYLLLDTPFDLLPPHYERLLFEVRLAGFTPVLAHPERSRPLARDPARLQAYVSQGAVAQVTAASLLGEFGPQAEEAAWEFLERGWAHAVASDGHGVDHRSPASLAEAFRQLARRLGEGAAVRLCCENPQAIALGRPLPG